MGRSRSTLQARWPCVHPNTGHQSPLTAALNVGMGSGSQPDMHWKQYPGEGQRCSPQLATDVFQVTWSSKVKLKKATEHTLCLDHRYLADGHNGRLTVDSGLSADLRRYEDTIPH